jgi:hypothetical protein
MWICSTGLVTPLSEQKKGGCHRAGPRLLNSWAPHFYFSGLSVLMVFKGGALDSGPPTWQLGFIHVEIPNFGRT